MAETLNDRPFVGYLILSVVALIALAVMGRTWFLVGLVAFVAAELSVTLRRMLDAERAHA